MIMRDHIADISIIVGLACLVASVFGIIVFITAVVLGLVIKGVRTVTK